MTNLARIQELSGEMEAFIADFERWCLANGIAPSTVTCRALGNTYALDAMRRRSARLVNDMAMLESIMKDPPFGRRGRKPALRSARP